MDQFARRTAAARHDATRLPRSLDIGKHVYIDDGVTIGRNVTIEDSVIVGRGVTLGDGATIQEAARIRDHATIGAGATISSGVLVNEGAAVDAHAYVGSSSTIGKDCWIGRRARFYGRYCQERAVIGANALIGHGVTIPATGQIPPQAIIVADVSDPLRCDNLHATRRNPMSFWPLLDAGTDVRGFQVFAYYNARTGRRHGWRIQAGCRDLTIQNARRHWSQNPEMLAKVEYLAAEIARRLPPVTTN